MLNDMFSTKLGGSVDTLAMTAIAGSFILANPLFSDIPPVAGVLSAALGSSWLGWRYFEGLRKKFILDTKLNIESSPAPFLVELGKSMKDGLLVGFKTDTGEPVWLPDEDIMRHMFIGGQSGVGKTVGISLLMFQQIQRGGGVLFIDGKMDGKELDNMYRYCKSAGREQDLLVINPGNPEMSNTYNPVLEGDPDEISARCLGLIPSTENNPGADYYKQAANQGISVLIAALKRAGLAYTFMDLTILLMSPKAIDFLENSCPPSDEKTQLSLFLDQFRAPGKDGAPPQLDLKRFKEVFGGIGGRMFIFGTGKFGKVLNTYQPEVRMFDAVMSNKIIYVMLPTMGKKVAATNFAKMLVGDLRTAISWVQALKEHEKPNPPFLAFFDEAGSYVNSEWSTMFEQSRSARIALCPSVQTLSNLDAVSPELTEMVIGNTWTKFFYKLGTADTAKRASELIGEEIQIGRTMTETNNQSSTSPLLRTEPEGGTGEASGRSFAEREQEALIVTPNHLKSLSKGECIALYGGDSVYNLRVPMISLSPEVVKEMGKTRLNHFRPTKWVKGIDLFRLSEKFMTRSERVDMARVARKEKKEMEQECEMEQQAAMETGDEPWE